MTLRKLSGNLIVGQEVAHTTFGEQLRIARKRAKLTQEELAEAVYTTKATISRYESNQRVPREEIFARICVVLQLEIDEMQHLAKMAGLSGAQLSKGVQNLSDWFDKVLDEDDTPPIPQKEKEILYAFRGLNEKGQEVAIQRVQELGKIPEYQEEPL